MGRASKDGVHYVGKYTYAWRGGPPVKSLRGTPAFKAEVQALRATRELKWKQPKPQIKEPNVADRLKLDPEENPGLTHLYRHYGFDGKLLYVGITRSAPNRWREHSKRSTWADEVAVITVDHYPTREEAEDAEAAVILAERPLFNRVVRIGQKAAA